MPLFSAGVLAGAYRGGRADLTRTLSHAVSDCPVNVGRLRRGYGQAFCVPTLDLVDAGGWGSIERVDCPQCRDVLGRIAATLMAGRCAR